MKRGAKFPLRAAITIDKLPNDPLPSFSLIPENELFTIGKVATARKPSTVSLKNFKGTRVVTREEI